MTGSQTNSQLGSSSSPGCTKGTSASKSISRLAGAQMDSSSLSYLKFIFEKVCRSFSGVSPLAGVSGQSVVALYPGRPTRCPWRTLCPSASAQCDRVIQGTGFHILQGLHRHLLQVHKRDFLKLWECSKCGLRLEDGNKMRRHYDLCSSGGQTPAREGQTLSTRLACVAAPPRSSTPATDGGPSPLVTPHSPAIGKFPGDPEGTSQGAGRPYGQLV